MVTVEYEANGFKGFYRAFGVSLFGAFCLRAGSFGLFQTGNDMNLTKNFRNNFFLMLLYSQLVSTTVRLTSYPIDTIRRRLINQGPNDIHHYKNVKDAVFTIY